LAADYGGAVASGTQYLFADTLGSTRMVITSTGTSTCVTSRLDYLPFGYEVPSSVGLRPNITDACAGQSLSTYSDDPVFRQKFTGKERDAETGLDFFEARYYASPQGRFTSPDKQYFQAEMLTDPQQFNLYSYARNSPLRFVDPSGEAIRLSKNPRVRDMQMDALCFLLGGDPGACSYLYQNPQPDGYVYVGIWSGGPNGDGPDFASLNPVSDALAQIINDPRIAEVNLVGGDDYIPGIHGTLNHPGHLGDGQANGVTVDIGGMIEVYVRKADDAGRYAEVPDYNMSDHRYGEVTPETALGHELGHALYMMKHPHGQGTKAGSDESAIDLESKVRTLKDPKAPTRTGHDDRPWWHLW
jgi:RHS repeat-associated protein